CRPRGFVVCRIRPTLESQPTIPQDPAVQEPVPWKSCYSAWHDPRTRQLRPGHDLRERPRPVPRRARHLRAAADQGPGVLVAVCRRAPGRGTRGPHPHQLRPGTAQAARLRGALPSAGQAPSRMAVAAEPEATRRSRLDDVLRAAKITTSGETRVLAPA